MESKTVKTAQTVTTSGIQKDTRKLQTQRIADKIGRTSARNNDSETKNSALLRKPKTNIDNEKGSTGAKTEKMNEEIDRQLRSRDRRKSTRRDAAYPANHGGNSDHGPADSNIILAIKKLSEQVESLCNYTKIIADRVENLELKFTTTSEDTTELKTILKETKNNTDSIIEKSSRLQKEIRFDQRNEKIEKKCKQIIAENSIIWKKRMNQRKISYWHCLQNALKAELYKDWQTNSPDYLPLKYRPKVNATDSDLILLMKSEEAEQKYADEIDTMLHYSHQHEERVLEIDEEVKTDIDGWSFSEEEQSCLLDLWTAEARKNETISQHLWDKRLDFLTKKKIEEEEMQNVRFINEEQEIMIQKRSYLKRNRFKIRNNEKRQTKSRDHDIQHRRNDHFQSARTAHSCHDNWRHGLQYTKDASN